jgi:hypothetical protein
MPCDDHDAWSAFHGARGDDITISQRALASVIECVGHTPHIQKKLRSNVVIRRVDLFDYLVKHNLSHQGDKNA